MSRAALGAFFGVLTALGLVGLFFSAAALSNAVDNFAGEPEDVYLMVFWLVVCLVLVGAWSRATLLTTKRLSTHPFDRYAAWMLLALGLLLTAAFLLEPVDRVFSVGGLIVLASGGLLHRIVGQSRRAA